MHRGSLIQMPRSGGALTALLCAAFLVGCSGDGEVLGFDFGGGSDTVDTELGAAVINGATTTVLSPPGWVDPHADGASNPGADMAAGRSAPQVPENLPEPCGSVTESRDIEHPDLGTVQLQLNRPGGMQEACLAAVDMTGRTLLTQSVPAYGDSFQFADPVTDATGNSFIFYNPGRYDGVITLIPTSNGYRDIGWGDEREYETTTNSYYYAELSGPGSDGRYSILSHANDCNPSCAQGTKTTTELTWDGNGYS